MKVIIGIAAVFAGIQVITNDVVNKAVFGNIAVIGILGIGAIVATAAVIVYRGLQTRKIS